MHVIISDIVLLYLWLNIIQDLDCFLYNIFEPINHVQIWPIDLARTLLFYISLSFAMEILIK